MRIVSDNDRCVGCLRKVTSASGYTKYITESCRHCGKARCIEACPVDAISRTEEGWVVVDRSECIGCRACSAACPFDIPQFDYEGKMFKCDGCGGDPACVKICPNGALSII